MAEKKKAKVPAMPGGWFLPSPAADWHYVAAGASRSDCGDWGRPQAGVYTERPGGAKAHPCAKCLFGADRVERQVVDATSDGRLGDGLGALSVPGLVVGRQQEGE